MKTYILAYCLKCELNGKTNITDHFEVFCDYNDIEETTLQQAEKRLQEIEQDFDENETFSLYTWNIAEIVKTSEHYETENSDPVQEAKGFLKENGYYTDNLWQIDDVKSKYKCDDETAQYVLNQTLNSDRIKQEINETIDFFAEEESLEENGN